MQFLAGLFQGYSSLQMKADVFSDAIFFAQKYLYRKKKKNVLYII